MDGPAASPTHLVLIPSYNTGARLFETVRDALAAWPVVWVVIDGSTDGTRAGLAQLAAHETRLRVLALPRNRGKGAAVHHGVQAAAAQGFTHVLTLDADGQHSIAHIAPMMALSAAQPQAMVLGRPVFDGTAPWERVWGRRASNALADIATGWAGIGDSLFGMRVYPVTPLLRAFAATPWMRRFDFDPEAAIRLCRAGVRPVNLATPVRYFAPSEGGVSHFNYLRDNALLAFMYTRLLIGGLFRPSRR